MADPNNALILQLSADIRGLEKQFARAKGVVDKDSRAMERRAKVANDNIGKAFARTGAENALSAITGHAPGAAAGLDKIGLAGAAATAVLGTLALAANRAIEAMSFGDELQAQADKLVISAEALQELQFAAEETDVPLEALQANLEKLNGTIGAFKTGIGGKKVAGAFEALGISKEDLANIENGVDLLPLLADRLGQVGDTAAQVQIARKLGIEDLLPLLRSGAEGLADMRNRARELGLVLDNQTVKALADADRQMELATRQIQANLRGAFAGLAVDIARVTSALATFLVELRTSAAGWAVFAREVGKGLNPLNLIPGGRTLMAAQEAARVQAGGRQRVADIKDALSKPLERPAGAGAGFELQIPRSGGGRGGGARKKPTDNLEPVDVETLDDAWAVVDRANEVFARWNGLKSGVELFDTGNLESTEEAMAQLGEELAELREREGEAWRDTLHDAFYGGFYELFTGGSLEDVIGAFWSRIAANAANSLADSLSTALTSALSGAGGGGLGGFLKGALGFAGGLFGGGGGLSPSLGVVDVGGLNLAGKWARGTDNMPPGLNLVGENGPEILNNARWGGQVIPNDILRGLTRMGGARGGDNFAWHGDMVFPGGAPRTHAERRQTREQVQAGVMRGLAMSKRKGF
jgi:hypothetical protein